MLKEIGVYQMKYEQMENDSNAQFWQITGVKRTTFEEMLTILSVAHTEKHRRRGGNPKLCMEERLIAALEYWRECRPFAHVAAMEYRKAAYLPIVSRKELLRLSFNPTRLAGGSLAKA